jgi:hypothetical protein
LPLDGHHMIIFYIFTQRLDENQQVDPIIID